MAVSQTFLVLHAPRVNVVNQKKKEFVMMTKMVIAVWEFLRLYLGGKQMMRLLLGSPERKGARPRSERSGRRRPCTLSSRPHAGAVPPGPPGGGRAGPRGSPCRLGERAARGRHQGQLFRNPPPPRPCPGLKSLSRPRSSEPAAALRARRPCSMAWNTNLRWRLPLTCLLLQVALVVLFGVFVRYDRDADAHWVEDKLHSNSSDLDNEFYYRYPSKSRRPAGPRVPQLRGSPPGPEPCLAAPPQPTLGTRAGARGGDAAPCPAPRRHSRLWGSRWRNGSMCTNSLSP